MTEMTETAADELPALESLRRPPLGDNPCLRGMLAEKPIWRVRTATGDEAWLVLGHKEIRDLLRDPRLGRTHPNPAQAPRLADNPIFEMIASGAAGGDPREVHAGMRALLVPYFSRKRMAALQPRVESIVDSAIDDMLAKTPPVDLWAEFTLPVPLRVLGELVGVPEDERDYMAELLDRMHETGAGSSPEDKMEILGYLTKLAAHKREHPGEDLITVIADGLDDWIVASVVCLLLFAGYEGVSTHIANGITRILTRPDLRSAVAEDPAVMESAVEEMLRTANVGGGWQPHYALEDIEIEGITIRAGELVLPDFAMGNHDPRQFDDPITVDFHRSPNQHLTFAHGPWHCIGAPLVRLELNVIFSRLLSRIPTLRLATELDDLLTPEIIKHRLSGTIDRLPVAW
jgi:cytochrome P450 monooxygenase